jgi:hypothetical protein
MASRTYRLTGIGESQVAELLGEGLLRATNPLVATYARADALDIRVSAVAEGDESAERLVDVAAAAVLEHLGKYVWASGATTWAEAIGGRLHDLGWTLAAVEIGTGGSLDALFGDASWLRFLESISVEAPAAIAHGAADDLGDADDDEVPDDLARFALRARELGGTEVGLAIRIRPRIADSTVSMAISTPSGERRVRRVVFLTGPMARFRAALAAAAVLLETLNEERPTS